MCSISSNSYTALASFGFSSMDADFVVFMADTLFLHLTVISTIISVSRTARNRIMANRVRTLLVGNVIGLSGSLLDSEVLVVVVVVIRADSSVIIKPVNVDNCYNSHL